MELNVTISSKHANKILGCNCLIISLWIRNKISKLHGESLISLIISRSIGFTATVSLETSTLNSLALVKYFTNSFTSDEVLSFRFVFFFQKKKMPNKLVVSINEYINKYNHIHNDDIIILLHQKYFRLFRIYINITCGYI